MAQDISGNVTNKISFQIDSKSWANLAKFQKRIAHVKKQLSGLSGNIKVNAVVNGINKVTAATTRGIQKVERAKKAAKGGIGLEFGKAKGSDTTYSNWWKDALNQQSLQQKAMLTDAYAMNKSFDRKIKNQQKGMLNEAYSMNRQYDKINAAKLGMQGKANSARERVSLAESSLDFKMRGASSNTRAEAFRQFKDISSQYTAGSISARQFTQSVNQSATSLLRAERAATRNRASLGDLRSGLIQATAAYSAFAAASKIARTGMDFEGIQASMKVFAGSDANVGKEIAYITAQADRLGISFQDAANNYTKFSIVTKDTLSQGTRRSVFEGIGEYATVLQADAQQVNRAYNAINQMFSKETIMSEELKGQLAEALFGSVDVFAKAAGMTKKELFKAMENAELMATEIIPKAAKEYSKLANTNNALGTATKKTRAEMNRFFNELKFASDEIFKGGFGEALSTIFRDMSTFLKDNKPALAAFGQTIGTAITILGKALIFAMAPLTALLKGFDSLFGDRGAKILGVVAAIFTLAKAVSLLAAAFLAVRTNAAKTLATLSRIPVVTAALAAEDAYVGKRGGDSYSKDWGVNEMLSKMQGSNMAQLIGNLFPVAGGIMNTLALDVNVNTTGVENLVDVKVNQKDSATRANMLADNKG